MKTQQTRAIVLRRTNYGEADRVLQLLTPKGKLSVMARSVRREKSRLAGGIELFAVSEVVIGEGKGELGVLVSARLIHFYSNIMANYDRMQFGYTAIKLVLKSSDIVGESDWYDVLLETFMGLDSSSIDINLVKTWFYLRYAMLMGYELSLWHDIVGNKLSKEQKYSYDVAEHGLRADDNGEITSEHIKILRLIATRSIRTLAQIGGINDVIGDCFNIVREHAAI